MDICPWLDTGAAGETGMVLSKTIHMDDLINAEFQGQSEQDNHWGEQLPEKLVAGTWLEITEQGGHPVEPSTQLTLLIRTS